MAGNHDDPDQSSGATAGVRKVRNRRDGCDISGGWCSARCDGELLHISVPRPALGAGKPKPACQACENLHGRQFAINILTVDQRNLALHFAGVPQPSVRNPFIEADAGDEPPVLQGCLAYIVCDPWAVHDAGDHKLFIGEVVGLSEVQPDAEQRPLGFFGGQFCRVESGERIWAANNELIAAMQQSLSFSW